MESNTLVSTGSLKELKAYQVGDNDIVAAYSKDEATQILTDYCGINYMEGITETEEVSKTLKITDEDGRHQGTLGDFMDDVTEPMYLMGWE